jgi:hypothetical protein
MVFTSNDSTLTNKLANLMSRAGGLDNAVGSFRHQSLKMTSA